MASAPRTAPQSAAAVIFNRGRVESRTGGASREEFPVSASQIRARPGARLAWCRRLCRSSLVLAGITAVVLWVAVTDLLRQGNLGTVLSAGR